MKNISELKNKLAEFYNNSELYFNQASEANKTFTDERKMLSGYILDNTKVLDVACGTAENAVLVGTRADYYGIEISDVALNAAKKKYLGNNNIKLEKGDAEKLPYNNNYFDTVISTYALEHFTDPRKVIDEMVRVCKPGGKIIIIAPAWDNPFWVIPSLAKVLNNPFNRLIYVFNQSIKLVLLATGLKKYYFDIIDQPAVLADGFEMDNDAVYIVRVREIINYFINKQCNIVFVRKFNDNLLKKITNIFEVKKNCLIIAGFMLNIVYRYLDAGLFIVSEKK